MSPFPEAQRTGQTTKMEIKDRGWRFYLNLFSCPNTLYIPGTPHCTIRGFSEQPTSQNPQRRIQSEFPGTGPGTQTQTDTQTTHFHLNIVLLPLQQPQSLKFISKDLSIPSLLAHSDTTPTTSPASFCALTPVNKPYEVVPSFDTQR